MITSERLWDVLIVHAIFHDMWDEIAEDDAVDVLPDVIGKIYVGLYNDSHLLGCFQLIQRTSVNWEIHTCLLKQYRKKFATLCGLEIYRWILNNIPGFHKLTSCVPQSQRHVLQYALKMGMVKEGVNRWSFAKNNSIMDQILVGITREEMIAKLKEL